MCELELKADYTYSKMEPIFIAAKEVLEDDKVTSVNVSTYLGMEEDNHARMSDSELKMEFEKMIISELFSNVDVRQPNAQRCTGESCRCGNKLSPQELVGLAIASTDNRTSESLGIFSRTSFLFNLSWTLKISEILFDILKSQRTKNMDSLCDFVFECSSVSSPGNLIISPRRRWIHSLERTFIARAFRKGSSPFHIDTRDNGLSNFRSRPVHTRQIKSLDLTSYPPELYDTALPNRKLDWIPFEKRRLKPIISEEMLLSCSSSNSSCSHQSTSSAHNCVSFGMLRCVQKSGTPHFEFSLDDDLGEVYVANPQKMDSSLDKSVDYLYLFLLRTGVKKEPRYHNSNAAGIVGKMKVSSSLILSSKCNFIETEFVLVGTHDDHSREMQASTSSSTKNKGLSKKVSEIFRSKHFVKHKSRPIFENFLSGEFASDLTNIEPGAMDHVAHDFVPNLELASIIVKDNRPTIKEVVAASGWGLKFLEKAEVSHALTSNPSSASKVCEETCMADSTKSARNINVIVPAGFHGGRITRNGGPSSLTERWRSGGRCDCGGWDIGCPITVLNNRSEALPHIESQDGCESVSLYIEDADHGDPIFRVVHINESLYHIYFESSLSALQAFSIGVAIIHSQSPDLYPKL